MFASFLLCLAGTDCIAHVVCDGAHVPIMKWEKFKDIVRENIRLKRNNCNTGIRKEFFGKLIFNKLLTWKTV